MLLRSFRFSSVFILSQNLSTSFFVSTIFIAYSLSESRKSKREAPFPLSVRRAAVSLTLLVFVQLVLGALMRHTSSGLAIPDFPKMGGLWIPTFSENMINNINKTISGNPTANDYRKAAVYYFEEDIDLNKAIKWIDIAFRDSDDLKYWQLNYKALIYEKAGKMKKAKEYAKMGLDKAKASNNPDGINVMSIVNKRLNKK